MIDLVAIESKKSPNIHYNTEHFLSLQEYFKITKGAINYFAPKYKINPLEIINNEDAFSNIVTSVIWADWAWTQNKLRSRKSYRNQSIMWALQKYLRRKRVQIQTVSLNTTGDKEGHFSFAATFLNDILDNIINKNLIKDRDLEIIKLYYLYNYTLKELGNTYHMTSEGIRKIITKGIKQLQIYNGINK